jgi:hypothetical protein
MVVMTVGGEGKERWTKTTMGCLCPGRRNDQERNQEKVEEKSRWPERSWAGRLCFAEDGMKLFR